MKNYAIIILAAGASTRMGSPKQLLTLGGETLIERIVKTALASKIKQVLIILGANAGKIHPKIVPFPVTILHNPNWKAGMSTSLKVGLTHLQTLTPSPTAIITLLCDQPYITSDLINQLVATYETSQAPIIATTCANTIGVPALFSATTFHDLKALKGQQGAKKVILKYADVLERVVFADGAIDLDTVEEYEEVRKGFWHK